MYKGRNKKIKKKEKKKRGSFTIIEEGNIKEKYENEKEKDSRRSQIPRQPFHSPISVKQRICTTQNPPPPPPPRHFHAPHPSLFSN